MLRGFTVKYCVKKLVTFELHDTAETAITREKPMKKGTRTGKVRLTEGCNPDWKDLCSGITFYAGYPLSRV
jgi:putative endonuclease